MGMLPREFQFVTWEALRGLFSDSFKAWKLKNELVNAVWMEYSKGKITQNEAQEKISKIAGSVKNLS